MSDPYAAVGGVTGRSLQLDQILTTLLRQAPDVEAAAVVSFDGLPMASALPAEMDEDRVAAMSAALLSLGERAAQGLGRGDLSQVYVEGDNGTVFLVSADDEAVLVAVGKAGAKVGLMLFEVKQAAGAVGTALRVHDSDPYQTAAAAAPVAPVVASVPEPQEPFVPAPVVPEVPAEPVVQAVPSIAPDLVPPVAPAPPIQPVAHVQPVQLADQAWEEDADRRPASVAPEGSSWA